MCTIKSLVVLVVVSISLLITCAPIITQIPNLGEGDGTMFDPAVVDACMEWNTTIAHVVKDVRWTGKQAYRVINEMTHDVVYIGTEQEAILVMAALNTWWINAPLQARVLLVYGYIDQANTEYDKYQSQLASMEAEVASFMAAIDRARSK